MIVIGSRAAKFFYNSFREPKDWDIVANQEEINNFLNKHKEKIVYSFPSSPYKQQVLFKDNTKIEFELDTSESNKILIDELSKNLYFNNGYINFYGENLSICPPVFLMLMKRSMLYWSVHWDKTILDYHFLRKQINRLDYQNIGRCERNFPNFITEKEKKFYDARFKENELKFGKKKISLKMSEQVFFGKSKKIRTMNHDLLHKKVMFYEQPLYTELKIYNNMPLLSEEKFRKNFTFDDRIKLAQEECLAIGFERYYIPKLLRKELTDAYESYKFGIKLVTSKLTKGWFCDFIIDHYDHILDISEKHLKKSENNVTEYFKNVI